MNWIHASLVIALTIAASGCGVETASTAATAAALKQKELEAGKKTLAESEKKIGQAMERIQQNAQKPEGAGK